MHGGTRGFSYSTSGGFSFSDPEHIFADFFRSMPGSMGDDEMGGIPGFGAFGSRRSSGMGNGRGSSGRYKDMNGGLRALTPEEVFHGVMKKMKIKRKKFDTTTGKQNIEDRILEVPIKQGLKAGSKIKFKDVGDQVEGGTQDLHFIVEEVSLSLSYMPCEKCS